MSKGLRIALVLASLVCAAMPSVASAVMPGPNGKIVFVSGRGAPANDDNKAQVYTLKFPSGSAVKVTPVGSANFFHAHPAWSPDRTRIAYARSAAGFGGERNIVIQNLITGTTTEFTPDGDGKNEDRPQWSPDGTRIAYQGQTAAASPNDIFVKSVNGGTPVNLTASNLDEKVPVWTPDSQTIFYSRSTLNTAGTAGIFKEKADNSEGLVLNPVIDEAAIDEYQPSLSPDGTKLCYSRGPSQTSPMTDIFTLASTGVGTPVNLSDRGGATGTSGGINCVWSPDQTKIVYTAGVFFSGRLGFQSAIDNNAIDNFDLLDDVAAHFDGNSDFAPDPAPTCLPTSVTVTFNDFGSIPLNCSDPAPESVSTDKEIVDAPNNGNLGSIIGNDPDESVIYTPNANFKGTDTFTFRGSDGTSDSPPATVTITVLGPKESTPMITEDRTAPVLAGLRITPNRFRRGSALPTIAARARIGTSISYTLDEASKVTFSFDQVVAGKRVGSRCLAKTRARARRRNCTRFVRKGSLERTVPAGLRRLRFAGRITATRRLGLGSYRLTLAAQDAVGNKATPRSARFRIVAR